MCHSAETEILPKQAVAGSSPVPRSTKTHAITRNLPLPPMGRLALSLRIARSMAQGVRLLAKCGRQRDRGYGLVDLDSGARLLRAPGHRRRRVARTANGLIP